MTTPRGSSLGLAVALFAEGIALGACAPKAEAPNRKPASVLVEPCDLAPEMPKLHNLEKPPADLLFVQLNSLGSQSYPFLMPKAQLEETLTRLSQLPKRQSSNDQLLAFQRLATDVWHSKESEPLSDGDGGSDFADKEGHRRGYCASSGSAISNESPLPWTEVRTRAYDPTNAWQADMLERSCGMAPIAVARQLHNHVWCPSFPAIETERVRGLEPQQVYLP